MPQLNKGGKFVFGLAENAIQISDSAVHMYGIAKEDKIFIFTGNKITGGFCVTNKTLLSQSKLKHIIDDCADFFTYSINQGEFICYKG